MDHTVNVAWFVDGSYRHHLTGFVYASYCGRLSQDTWMNHTVNVGRFCGWIITDHLAGFVDASYFGHQLQVLWMDHAFVVWITKSQKSWRKISLV